MTTQKIDNPAGRLQTADLRVAHIEPVEPPAAIKATVPISEPAVRTVLEGRQALRDAMAGKDPRLVVIVGPCSIHDPKGAMEYAERLARLSAEVKHSLLVVMRVYFEKPRTTIGWKGLINDPYLDGTQDINEGLKKGRRILLAINEMGLPCASEFLDPIVPQYTADLVSWAAIGARTTESQTHREMASGLSMPVGFKNATDGDLQTALDAIVSARHAHSFLGIDQAGHTAIVRTTGNPDVHIVLRGGNGGPNYSEAHIEFTRVRLEGSAAPRPNISASRRLVMVDCSHGNSSKDYRKQPLVFEDILRQRLAGEMALLGVMLESHLHEGNQKPGPVDSLRYGVSITDGCINWETTEALLRGAHAALSKAK